MPFAALKDPNDKADYGLTWAKNLGADTISASTWIVPAGLTKESESNTTTTATVRLSGGTVGEQYDVTNRVNTAAGQQLDQTITIYIRQR